MTVLLVNEDGTNIVAQGEVTPFVASAESPAAPGEQSSLCASNQTMSISASRENPLIEACPLQEQVFSPSDTLNPRKKLDAQPIVPICPNFPLPEGYDINVFRVDVTRWNSRETTLSIS